VRLPIRVRLTAWYVLLVAAAIVLLGAFVLVRLRADLTADYDRSLHLAAGRIQSLYELEGPAQFASLSGDVVSVLPADSGAQLIAAHGALTASAGRDLPSAALLDAAQRRRVLAGHKLVMTTHGRTDSEPFRVYATAVRRGTERSALVVASSLEGVDAAVHRVRSLILIGGPALLLVLATCGWVLARRALLPVARLTEHAQRIEVDRLEERVPVPRASDEIGRLAVTLNHMLHRLERGVQDKRRLVADASHELRTPLAAMRSELDVALRYGRLQPEAVEVLESAREEVERMGRTVEDLLTLARFDEGRLELLPRPFALGPVIREVAAELGPIAADKQVTIVMDTDDSVVTADRERVRQVVTNLVDNAVRYSHPGGEVKVATWRRDGDVGIRVEDAGVGIPSPALPRVFDRFFRVDRARTRTPGGSGLGLAIAQEIVAAHGGRVWAESDEGRGSRFTVALPADGGQTAPAAGNPAGAELP
jgi:heavy metal sensor kinase